MESKDILSQLNPQQRLAVETTQGPVMVVAGPGTGKTHLLTARIVHLLQSTDTLPTEILCLTYTDAGAVAMRQRLARHVGPAAHRVMIRTFHSFCDWVMAEYPEEFWPLRGPRQIASDLDRTLFYRQIIDTLSAQSPLRPFGDPYLWQRSFFSWLSALKREGFTPDQARQHITRAAEADFQANPSNFYKRKQKEHQAGDEKPAERKKHTEKLARTLECLTVWQHLETLTAQQQLHDFDDMIHWVNHVLATHPIVKSDLQERFQYIMVDEYQDTNGSQNQILWHLTDYWESPNLMVVGDDDQAIYRFQGASLQNILDFTTRFPSATSISLKQNYRSHQHILDLSYQLVRHNAQRLDPSKALTAAGPVTDNRLALTRHTYETPMEEAVAIGHTIQQLLSAGIPAGEVALLCRINRHCNFFAQSLSRLGIPVSNRQRTDILQRPVVRALVQLLDLWAHVIPTGQSPTHTDVLLIESLLAPWWGHDPAAVYALSRQRRRSQTLIDQFLTDQLDLPDTLAHSFTTLVRTASDSRHLGPSGVVEHLLHQSGLLEYVLRPENPDRWVDLLALQTLQQWVTDSRLTDTPAVIERLKLHTDTHTPILPPLTGGRPDAVQILTTHRAKGLEYEAVFVPQLTARTWPKSENKQKIYMPQTQHPDSLEEERRLLFVALTRARAQLHLSTTHTLPDGKTVSTSPHWHELDSDLWPDPDTADTPPSSFDITPLLPSQRPASDSATTHALLLDRLTHFRWSYTALRDWLLCPLKVKWKHLLRVPQRTNPSLALGSALHTALEKFFDHFNTTGEVQTLPQLQQYFDEHLQREPNLSPADHRLSSEQGHHILTHYFEAHAHTFGQANTLQEVNLRPYAPTIGEVPVTGKIDQIILGEPLPDGTRAATLIDYKSSKPKSLSNYQDQLVMYHALVTASPQLQLTPVACGLQFLQAGDNGQFKAPTFTPSPEQLAALTTQLTTAHQQLLTLDFPVIDPQTVDYRQRDEVIYWQQFDDQHA